MKFYLKIQYKRFCRSSFQRGIHPLLSTVLLLTAFTGLSELFFTRIAIPGYLYSMVALLIIAVSASPARMAFLWQHFSQRNFYKIRLLEQVMLALPFLLFLLYKNQLLPAVLLCTGAVILLFLPASTRIRFTLPTPFGRYPFEFTRGFRRLFLFWLAAYLVTYFAITSHNFNLGIITLLSTFLVSASFYSNAEPDYYIWIYHHNPQRFIGHKLRIILLYSALPGMPAAIALTTCFPQEYWFTMLALITGLFYTILFMLLKYVSYPNEASISDAFLLAVSVLFPPFMLITLPLFYYRSVRNLKSFLHD